MALLKDVQTALLKFVAQLGMDYQDVGSAVLVSLAAGVAFRFLIHIPFAWAGLIPLWFFVMNRYYAPVHELPINHRLDGTYHSLRAAGLSRAGYLLASGLLFALTLLVLTVPFFLAFAGLSAGRAGLGHVLRSVGIMQVSAFQSVPQRLAASPRPVRVQICPVGI